MDPRVVFETDRLVVRDWATDDAGRVFDIAGAHRRTGRSSADWGWVACAT
jgi:hypothetical protein